MKIWLRVEGKARDQRNLWQRITNRQPIPYRHDEEITGDKVVTLVARHPDGHEFIWRQRPGDKPLISDLGGKVN